MPRKSPPFTHTEEDKAILDRWIRSRTMETRLAERAKIIMRSMEGQGVTQIARDLKLRPNTVIDWKRRFQQNGINGLYDLPRPGKPAVYGRDFRNKILETLEQPPPAGQAVWDGQAVAAQIGSSTHAVWRVLRKEGICLSRQRSWCVSTDPEFVPKAAEIVGLYLNPPENAIVISVDEKPSIQALERATGYVETDNGKIVRGYKSTYKRHGTLNLFAALEIATGAVHTQTTQYKRRIEFLEFLDKVVADLPADKEIHIILDNYCTHKKNEAWHSQHKNVFFHYTPTSASWLNQIEIWFSIMSRKALRGASFKNTGELREAIEAFVEAYSQKAKPFVWRKREVRGAQLRNTIVNLRN